MKCNQISPSTSAFSDLMLPVASDFFQALAQMMSPEEIDEYQCLNCQKKQRALKFLSLTSIPQLAIATIQRFGYDFVSDSYKKDVNPVTCPVALDFSKLVRVDYSTFCGSDLAFSK